MNHFAAVGKLSIGIFHDLVNLFNSLALSIERLSYAKEKQEGLTKNIEYTCEASRRMEHFIHTVEKHLLAKKSRKCFSLNEAIEESIELHCFKARTENVTLIFKAEETVLKIANPLQFHHIVSNLVMNAIDSYKEMEGGIRDVIIELKKKDGRALIVVQDQGCGIPQNSIPKIFDPFLTTKDKKEGMGLGLSTTKEIVEKEFKGSISVKSKIHKGSCFIVSIPLRTKR